MMNRFFSLMEEDTNAPSSGELDILVEGGRLTGIGMEADNVGTNGHGREMLRNSSSAGGNLVRSKSERGIRSMRWRR